MDTTPKVIALIAALATLAGCADTGQGNHAQPYQSWTGGLVNIWVPTGAPKGVVIVHQGHAAFTDPRYDLTPFVQSLVANGYMVYGFEMPPDNTGPIERYYQPVLDVIATLPSSMKVYCAGFSGGGWTCSMVTALEPRVLYGYSVQGDVWFPGDTCAGAHWFEYCNPPIPLADIYSTTAAKVMRVYLPQDQDDATSPWAASSWPVVPSYPYVMDYTAITHQWTAWDTDFIINDLANH